MKLRCSPYYLLNFIYRRGFVLFALPLQAFLLKNINPYIAARVYLINTFLILVFVIAGCLSFQNRSLTISNKTLIFEKGIIFKSHLPAKINSVSALSLTSNPLQRILGVRKITVVLSKAQLILYVSKEKAKAATRIFTHSKIKAQLIFQNGFVPTLLLSAGFYNAFTSALTFIPVLQKLSSLMSNLSAQSFPLSNVSLFFRDTINLILSAFTVTIITLWIFGVLITYSRYHNLQIYNDGFHIRIHEGLFVKRNIHACKQRISAVVLRQNILMSVLHRYTGEFRIADEKKKNRLTFICGESHKRCLCVLSLLSKDFDISQGTKLRPHAKSLWGYTYLPMTCLLVFSVLSVAADIYSPYVSKTNFSLFITLWLCVWFLFRVSVFKRCFLSRNKSSLIICTYTKMTFCKVYIPKEKIHSLKISQSIFQKRLGTCNLRVYVKSVKPLSFRIKHIEKTRTAELTTELCG